MDMPNSSQLAAMGRHIVTYAAGGITVAATLHVISAGDASALTNSITQISNGVAEIALGLGPIIALASGAFAAWTASRKSQVAAVNAIPGVKVVAEASPSPVVVAPPASK